MKIESTCGKEFFYGRSCWYFITKPNGNRVMYEEVEKYTKEIFERTGCFIVKSYHGLAFIEEKRKAQELIKKLSN